MICTNCGKTNADDLKYCTNCGKELERAAAAKGASKRAGTRKTDRKTDRDLAAKTERDSAAKTERASARKTDGEEVRKSARVTAQHVTKETLDANDLPLLDASSVQPVSIPQTEARPALLTLADDKAPDEAARVPLIALTEGRNCPICDAPLSDEYRFCVNCGARYSQYALRTIEAPDLPQAATPVHEEPPAPSLPTEMHTRIPTSDVKAPNSAPDPHAHVPSSEFASARRGIERVSFIPQTAQPQPADSQAPFSLFHVNDDGSLGEQIPMTTGENIIGRTSSPLLATDRFVSPKHLRITCNAQNATIEDCSSMNGSFIRIANESVELQNGDIFRIGEELLCYFTGDSAQPLLSNPTREKTALLGGTESPGWGYLRVIMGAFSEGNVYRLTKKTVSLGRVKADILFPRDGFVSGTHASLRLRESSVILTDLDSSNGTFVRMKRPKTISRSAFILIGNQLLKLMPAMTR